MNIQLGLGGQLTNLVINTNFEKLPTKKEFLESLKYLLHESIIKLIEQDLIFTPWPKEFTKRVFIDIPNVNGWIMLSNF